MKNLKSLLTKNLMIGCLATTNFAAVGYIVSLNIQKNQLLSKIIQLELKPEKIVKAPTPAPRKAVIEPNAYFKNDNAMQVCYETYIAQNPTVDEGAVLFHWTFNDFGTVNNLELMKTDFDDDKFIQCLSEKIQEINIPAANVPKATIIAHTFKFKRKTLGHVAFE